MKAQFSFIEKRSQKLYIAFILKVLTYFIVYNMRNIERKLKAKVAGVVL